MQMLILPHNLTDSSKIAWILAYHSLYWLRRAWVCHH